MSNVSTEQQKVSAEMWRLAGELNEAIQRAVGIGLRVEIEDRRHQTLGDRFPIPRVNVTVSLPFSRDDGEGWEG